VEATPVSQAAVAQTLDLAVDWQIWRNRGMNKHFEVDQETAEESKTTT
jgi:hypothetical protein